MFHQFPAMLYQYICKFILAFKYSVWSINLLKNESNKTISITNVHAVAQVPAWWLFCANGSHFFFYVREYFMIELWILAMIMIPGAFTDKLLASGLVMESMFKFLHET